MKLVPPLVITDAILSASSVPETDYPAWDDEETYAPGDRVISAHRIYESLIDANAGNAPGSGTAWLDTGPTNRWAMFDAAAGARTTASTTISVTLMPPEAVDAIGLLDMDASSVRVQVIADGDTIFDETDATGAPTLTFIDLPGAPGATIIVTLEPVSGATAIGKLIVGTAFDLGDTEDGPTVSITDYSRRETDDFGVTTIVERAWARKLTVRSRIESARVDTVHRRVTDVRARAALWIGEPGFESLTLYGFFKDYSVDLQLGTASFCSLTIEGLPSAETTNPVIDPSPDLPSDFLVIRPQAVTDAVLTASNAPEDDHPAWDAEATYALGDRVISTATHRIYESAIADNLGNDPTAGATQWIDTGPTNRWAMFDEALGTLTTRTGSLTVNLKPSADVNGLAILDADAATVRVQAPGYDETLAATVGGEPIRSLTFLDLDVTAGATIVVTIDAASGALPVSVGTLLIGTVEPMGLAEISPTLGITDYSLKETDDFGNTEPVERAWAKRMSVKAQITTPALDNLVRRVASLRARPALWIGQAGFDSLTIYGFFRDFSAEVSERVSVCSYTIEGLSEAVTLSPSVVNWVDIVDSDPENHPKPEDGATVGAPEGTPVGDRPAEDVIADIDQLEIDADAAMTAAANALSAALAAQQDVIDLGTDLTTQIDDLAADITAAGGDIETLQSTVATQGAAITDNATAISNAVGDLATLSSTVGTQGSAITENATAISGLELTAASLTTTVSAGPAALNRNPTFAVWEDGQTFPTGYLAHTNTAPSQSFAKVPGNYGNALRVTNTLPDSAEIIGFWAWGATADPTSALTHPALSLAGPGWYLIEAEITLVSGTLASSGVALQGYDASASYVSGATARLQFDIDPDSSGTVVGNGTVGKTYHFSKLVQLTQATISSLRLIGQNYRSTFGPVAAKSITWHKLTVRPGNGSDVTVVQHAEAISTLDTQYASLSSTVSTQGGTITAHATAISTLQGDVSTLESTVSTQGSSISSLQSASTTQAGQLASLTTEVRAGGVAINRSIYRDDWSGGYPVGWQAWYSASQGAVSKVEGIYGSALQIASNVADATEAGYGVYSRANSTQPGMMKAGPGWYEIEAEVELVSGNLGGAGVRLQGYDDALDYQQTALFALSTTPDVTGVAPGAGVAGRVYRFKQVVQLTNSNITVLRLVAAAQMGSTSDFRTKTIVFHRLDVSPVAAQVVQNITAVNTLNTQYADLSTTVGTQGVTITSHTSAISTINGNVTTLFGKAGVSVDVNGRVTGWETNNNGDSGDFRIHADYFAIEKPGGGNRTVYSDGSWRIIAGSMMSVWGCGFGSSGQFIEWTGPVQSDLSNCTESNAVKYVKTNGDAYYAGALSAGLLINRGQTTLTSSDASIVVGPFGTNGDPKTVVVSYTYARSYRCNASTGGISGSGSATIVIERDLGSGWLTIGSFTANETLRSVIVDGDPSVKDTVRWSMGGSVTLTDNSPSGSITLRARISARTLPTFSGTSITADATGQTLGVVSTE